MSSVETTRVLEIHYEEGGPADGKPLLLLHGWPDDATAWRKVSPRLNAAGYHTVTPYLRGTGSTCFTSPDTIRDGRAVALAADALELADALGWEEFQVAGHDWGGRTAYVLAALAPDRVQRIASLAIGYAPNGEFSVPAWDQSRRWWYQWLMSTDRGADQVRRDPVGFARIQWDTWGPRGWFDEAEWRQAARSFVAKDWVEITLNGYRSRWRDDTPADPRYAALQDSVRRTKEISTPTLLIVGAEDYCDPPTESAGDAEYFTGPYQQVVLEGSGHFPLRDAADRVANALLEHFQ